MLAFLARKSPISRPNDLRSPEYVNTILKLKNKTQELHKLLVYLLGSHSPKPIFTFLQIKYADEKRLLDLLWDDKNAEVLVPLYVRLLAKLQTIKDVQPLLSTQLKDWTLMDAVFISLQNDQHIETAFQLIQHGFTNEAFATTENQQKIFNHILKMSAEEKSQVVEQVNSELDAQPLAIFFADNNQLKNEMALMIHTAEEGYPLVRLRM